MQKKNPVLLFDLDNTLLDFDAAERAAMTRVLTECGVEATDERLKLYNKINLQHWKRLELGELDRAGVQHGRFREFFREIGVDLDPVSVQNTYERYLADGYMVLPGAKELLEALDGKYDMYIISNGSTNIQYSRLAHSGIEKYFKKVFISEELGKNKPSREFFELCFAQIEGFDPDNALIIGDSLTSDIRGGLNVGVKTCWFNPKGQPPRADIPADYTISALAELPELLEKL